MNAKPWWKSKTLWTNIAVIGVGVQQNLSALDGVVSPEVFGFALFVIGSINVILRVVTNSAVTK